jgi:hypothetical protein
MLRLDRPGTNGTTRMPATPVDAGVRCGWLGRVEVGDSLPSERNDGSLEPADARVW